MASNFAYKAKNRDGQIIAGNILADDQAAVASFIQSQGYYVVKIEKSREESLVQGLLYRLQPVRARELAVFCRQFSTMIDAGIPVLTCLSILIDQTVNPNLKKSLQNIYKRVREGQALSHSMGDERDVFPNIMVKMVSAGEVSGSLDVVLNRLAVHYEKEYKLNAKVKSAMTYPAVVVIMMVMAVFVILFHVMPPFVTMFTGMNVEMPLPTRILLMTSELIRQYFFFLTVILVGIAYGVKKMLRQHWARVIRDNMILHIPIIGALRRKVAIAQFSRSLSTLLKGGVSITTALEVVREITNDSNMSKTLRQVHGSVQQGMTVGQQLAGSSIFTAMAVQMVSIGEETGQLDKMLEKVADFYESDIEDTVNQLSSLLEPLLVGCLGVVVGGMVMAIMLPIFDVITYIPK